MSTRPSGIGRHLGEQPAGEGLKRPVDDVERRRPAAVGLADDDARAHLDGRQLALAGHQLGLVLGLLVRVAEPLAAGQVALGEAAAAAPGDVGGGDVDDAVERLELAGQIEDAPRALDVDGARRLEGQGERDRRRAVHDAGRGAPHDLAVEPAEAEPRRDQVGGHRAQPLRRLRRRVVEAPEELVDARLRAGAVGRADREQDVPAVVVVSSRAISSIPRNPVPP
jgi:hypothetical protein